MPPMHSPAMLYLTRPNHLLGVWIALLSWTCKINNQRTVCPLVLTQAKHAKKGAETKWQQDELGDGLNLVNGGMNLDVNNVDVSQFVIGSALVYSVFILVCSFHRNDIHCSKKAITYAPSSKAHSKIHEKH